MVFAASVVGFEPLTLLGCSEYNQAEIRVEKEMLVADHELGDAVHGFELVVVRAPEPSATHFSKSQEYLNIQCIDYKV